MTKRKLDPRTAKERCAKVYYQGCEVQGHPEGLPKSSEPSGPTGATKTQVHVAVQESERVQESEGRSEVDIHVGRACEVAGTEDMDMAELAAEEGVELHPFWALLQAVRYELWGDKE